MDGILKFAKFPYRRCGNLIVLNIDLKFSKVDETANNVL